MDPLVVAVLVVAALCSCGVDAHSWNCEKGEIDAKDGNVCCDSEATQELRRELGKADHAPHQIATAIRSIMEKREKGVRVFTFLPHFLLLFRVLQEDGRFWWEARISVTPTIESVCFTVKLH